MKLSTCRRLSEEFDIVDIITHAVSGAWAHATNIPPCLSVSVKLHVRILNVLAGLKVYKRHQYSIRTVLVMERLAILSCTKKCVQSGY